MFAPATLIVALVALGQPESAPGQRGAAGGQAAREPVATTIVNGLGMRFVQIPAGSFDMGAEVPEWERPVHRVRVKAFWMGVTEVTQAQWQAVMGGNPSHFRKAGPDAPVEMVSWDDAQAFIAKLKALDPARRYRLPSEAEWEYACRANAKADPYGPAEEVAWITENSGGTTHRVAQKRPNAFGLFDMLGNVPEWVQDAWHDNYVGAPDDGSAWVEPGVALHPLRGGGWDLPAFFLHAGVRGPLDPIHRLGFRVAFDAPAGAGADRFPELAGAYLGQAPPGLTPTRFAERAGGRSPLQPAAERQSSTHFAIGFPSGSSRRISPKLSSFSAGSIFWRSPTITKTIPSGWTAAFAARTRSCDVSAPTFPP